MLQVIAWISYVHWPLAFTLDCPVCRALKLGRQIKIFFALHEA